MSLYPIDPNAIVANASNIMTGGNPPYSHDAFLAFYPQFTGLVPLVVIDQFIAGATAKVLQARWHDDWVFGMADLIAHYCTLYLMKVGGGTQTVTSVIANAMPKGLQTSKSVGDVSASYDFGTMSEEFKGWGDLGLTIYGRDFVTKAKTLSKAGMYLY